MVSEITGCDGETRWDTTKPDGTPRKLLDVSRMASAGWASSIALADGLAQTCARYLDHLNSLRSV